jgi:hypothetical protein
MSKMPKLNMSAALDTWVSILMRRIHKLPAYALPNGNCAPAIDKCLGITIAAVIAATDACTVYTAASR